MRDVPVPKPQQLLHDASVPWLSMVACLYGVEKTVQYKVLRTAPWVDICYVSVRSSPGSDRGPRAAQCAA
jgi:hypothetical protein